MCEWNKEVHVEIRFEEIAAEHVQGYVSRISIVLGFWVGLMALMAGVIFQHSFAMFSDYEDRAEDVESYGRFRPSYCNTFSLTSNIAIFVTNFHIFIMSGVITLVDRESQLFPIENMLRCILSLAIASMSGVQLEAQLNVMALDRFPGGPQAKSWSG